MTESPVSRHPLADPDPVAPPVRRRRVRGLRLTAVPSTALTAQVLGGGAALAGVWLTWGASIALIAGGIAAAVLGALREAGKL
jgi:hypothetical protein